MRSFGHSPVLASLLVLSVIQCGATPREMVDPLIGLSFDPEMIRFDVFSVPSDVETQFGPGPQWVFARYASGSTELLVVAGFQRIDADGDAPPLWEPDFGAVLRRSETRTEILGVPDRLFGREPIATEIEVSGLMRDAASRYLRAFGGKQRLADAIAAAGLRPADLPGPLVGEFSAIGVSIP